jgi:hypothetical protein
MIVRNVCRRLVAEMRILARGIAVGIEAITQRFR